MLFHPGDTLLCIGDSITDAGRGQPVGEEPWSSLGNGYVHFLSALLGARHPELRIRVRNVGTSGNTVRDLDARWQRDVLDLKPDVLTCMIGINDVWRQFDSPKTPGASVPLDEYAETLDRLIASAPWPVVILTPFFIEPLVADPMRARMDEYGAACREIAGRRGLPLVDTQAVFNRLLDVEHSSAIAWDRVHPGATGHMAIALALFDVLTLTPRVGTD